MSLAVQGIWGKWGTFVVAVAIDFVLLGWFSHFPGVVAFSVFAVESVLSMSFGNHACQSFI